MVESLRPIKLTGKAFMKISHYTQLADEEIAGLLIVGQDEEGIVVEDVILFEQTASSASVDLSREDIDKFLRSLIISNKSDIIPKIKGWWHSHGTGSTFWSDTDDNTIERLMRRMDFVISLVSNKSTDLRARIDTKKPFPMSIDEVETVTDMKDIPFFVRCKEEFEKKVKESTYTSYGNTTQKDLNGKDLEDEELTDEEAYEKYGIRRGYIDSRWG